MHPFERGGSLLLDAGLAAEDTVRLADNDLNTTTETAPAASICGLSHSTRSPGRSGTAFVVAHYIGRDLR